MVMMSLDPENGLVHSSHSGAIIPRFWESSNWAIIGLVGMTVLLVSGKVLVLRYLAHLPRPSPSASILASVLEPQLSPGAPYPPQRIRFISNGLSRSSCLGTMRSA